MEVYAHQNLEDKMDAPLINALDEKDGCTQKIDAQMYNALDEIVGCTQKNGCAHVQCL